MTRLRIAVVAAGVALFATFAWAAQLDYFGYQQYGGAWCDAEKSPSNDDDDDLMCWATTASSVLAWTGWAATGLSSRNPRQSSCSRWGRWGWRVSREKGETKGTNPDKFLDNQARR